MHLKNLTLSSQFPPKALGSTLKKLHKAMQDRLRALDAEALRLLAEQGIRGDDSADVRSRRLTTTSLRMRFLWLSPQMRADDSIDLSSALL